MDKFEETFLTEIKKDIDLIQYIDDENQRINVFESTLKSLMLIKDEQIHENIKKFKQKITTMDNQIHEKQEEINTMIQDKNKEINELYKEFLLKL